MFARSEIRIPFILCFGLAAALSPPGRGWPFLLDAWLWTGFRDIRPSFTWSLLPVAVSVAMVIADCAGHYCRPWQPRVRQVTLWVTGIIVIGGLLLWTLRVQRWFGDLAHVDSDPLQQWTIETAEPLGVLITYLTVHWGTAHGVLPSTAIAFSTTVFGASALAAMFLWARSVTSQWPLAFAMFMSSGFMLLFCGYPEKGTPKALALVAWYLYVTMRALHTSRKRLLLASSGVLSLAALMHGSALCLLPAHAWYVWRPSGWRRGLAGMGIFLVPIAAIAVYVFWGAPMAGGPWGNLRAPLAWLDEYCRINCGYKFWTSAHAIDVLNCLLALSPVALLCWPEALARSRDVSERWLALCAAGGFFVSAVWFPGFGYLPDWDIFALAPCLVSYHAILVGARRMTPESFRRLALAWIVGAGVHAFSFWRYFQLNL